VSDHCAIVVKSAVIDSGPKTFRVLNIWQSELDFKDKLRNGGILIK